MQEEVENEEQDDEVYKENGVYVFQGFADVKLFLTSKEDWISLTPDEADAFARALQKHAAVVRDRQNTIFGKTNGQD